MKPVLKIWTWLAAVSLLLAACVSRAPASTAEATDANPNAVFTAAAETAQAMMTQMAATTPTAAPATPTQPVPTTEAATAPEVTPEAPLTSTQAIGGTTPAAPPAGGGTTPVAPPAGGGAATQGNLAEFVQDVTIPDGTNMDPGERFVKTWRLKNAGTTTWTTDYEVIFSSGSQMDAPASVAMPTTVEPGGTVDISVNFVAPNDAGEYFSYWLIQDAAGNQFGLAPAGNAPFYVQIQVGGGGDTDEEADTTPTDEDDDDDADSNVSAGGLSGVTVSIDEPIVSGECPHTFTIAATFSLTSPGTITYKLEGGTDNPNFPLNLPSPVTANAKSGRSTNYFTMKFDSSVSGWLQLHITNPDDVLSDRVNFSLTCSNS